MAKPSLSKRDLETLALVNNPTAQNQLRKAMETKRAESAARSAKAFSSLLAKRKKYRETQLAKELTVDIRQSRRGEHFIVIDGGGLNAPIWLSFQAATSLLSTVPDVKNLMAELQNMKPAVEDKE